MPGSRSRTVQFTPALSEFAGITLFSGSGGQLSRSSLHGAVEIAKPDTYDPFRGWSCRKGRQRIRDPEGGDTRLNSQARAAACGIDMVRGHGTTAWTRARLLAGHSNMDFKTRNFA